MNVRALLGLAAMAAACIAPTPFALAAEQQPAHAMPLSAPADEGRVIVKFKAEAETVKTHRLSPQGDRASTFAVLQRRADALGARRGLALSSGRAVSELSQVVRAKGTDSSTLARLLAMDSQVEYAEVDHRRRRLAIPNDTLFTPALGASPESGQWYLKAPSAETPASINATSAWDTSTGRDDMVIAVLDTGVRFDHADLAVRLLPGRDMVSNATVANDGQSRANDDRDSDAADPGDWISANDLQNSLFSSCEESRSSWHGTMVSGLIGAVSNNGLGMAGMTWSGRILPVRVLGKCFGYDSDIQAGIQWAAGVPLPTEPSNATPAKVLNLSLGGDGACSKGYKDAIGAALAKGAVIVAAAGNSKGHAVETPGNCPGVIAVAGVRHVGTKVGYSDLGPEVALAAPAGNCVNTGPNDPCLYPILTTVNPGQRGPVSNANGGSTYTDGFNTSVGTSFSTPLVAGTAALMLSVNPALTPSQVKSMLQSSARPFPVIGGSAGIGACQAPSTGDQEECYCTTSTCGAGMLDAGLAVKNAAASANGLLAVITSASSTVSGEILSLSAVQTQLGPGRTATYNWSIAGGDASASFIGAVDGTSATLTTSSPGTVTVRLTVTDDANNMSTVHKQIAVAAPATPSSTPAPSSSSGGGGGGGALSWPWLLALALATAALRKPRPA